MTDKNFLDSVIAERMQMHYSMRRGGTADDTKNVLLSLESEYTQALEALPDDVRATIETFVKSLNSRAADDETFFYMKGVKDGLLLYEALTGL